MKDIDGNSSKAQATKGKSRTVSSPPKRGPESLATKLGKAILMAADAGYSLKVEKLTGAPLVSLSENPWDRLTES